MSEDSDQSSDSSTASNTYANSGCQDPNVITVAQLRDVARDNGVRFHKKDRRAEMVQIVSQWMTDQSRGGH